MAIRYARAALIVAACALAAPSRVAAQRGLGGAAGRSTQPLTQQRELARSVHRALACTQCHGESETMGAGVGRGMMGERGEGRPGAVETCGSCHAQAMAAYGSSVHASAVRRGTPHAPTCVSCHGSHALMAVADLRSPVSKLRASEATCARCHGRTSAMAIHAPRSNAVEDYRRSFHGLSAALGDRRVATCVSCHSAHDIRAAREPGSSVSAARMHRTCARCHSGTTPTFATGGVHHDPTLPGHRMVDAMRYGYLVLIVAVIGGMLLHNGLDLWGRLRDRWMRRRRVRAAAIRAAPVPATRGSTLASASGTEARTYLRFTVNERVQHWTLAASFATLAVTGFALKYTWPLPYVDAQQGALLRGLLHRVAAIAFMGLAAYHAVYMLLTRRGRYNLRSFLPRFRSVGDVLCGCAACLRLGPPSRADWRDLVQLVRYNLGRTATRPAMGRFTYAEKMEYLALVWGTAVMIGTGVILWWKVPFLNRFQFWVYDLVTTMHLYEALLATLSIFAWHFYFTVYNPDVFPVSKTMVTGHISHEEMERDHAAELRTLEAHTVVDGESRAES
jgi:cytochrome b subunit of formate dehydrogenase